MLKKIICAVSCALSSSVFAYMSPYIGLDVGVNNADIQLKNSFNTVDLTSQGMQSGLLAGYGGMLNNKFYLAGEAFMNGSTSHTSWKNISPSGVANARFKNTYNYGLSMLPGFKITSDTIIYAKVGIIRSRFQLEQSGGPITQTETGNTVTGGQLGGGLELSLSKNLKLRGEYVYTAYQSFDAFGSRIKPTGHQLNAILVYQFA